MQNFIYVSTWVWGGENNKVILDIRRNSRDFTLKISLGNSHVETTLGKDELIALKEKIENALLDA